jgi:vacuolar protein sorting-associated protein 53
MAFSTMARTSWVTISQVSGPSAYVADLESGMQSVVGIIEPRVEQKKYLRNFFDKCARRAFPPSHVKQQLDVLCSLMLARFTNALIKSRPLKEIGAEQVSVPLCLRSQLLIVTNRALSIFKLLKLPCSNCPGNS